MKIATADGLPAVPNWADMKSFVLTALMTIAWLSSSTAVSRLGQANESQPNVVIIGQQWFRNKTPFETGHAFFQASQETVPDLEEFHSTLCPISRRPERHPKGECPYEAVAEQESGIAKEVNEFVYTVRVRNSGQRTIKSILWNYVFLDPNTGKELARHVFYSERQLAPGQTKTLIATSLRPPTRVITVEMLSSKEVETYREHVEIKQVEYADGSTLGKGEILSTLDAGK